MIRNMKNFFIRKSYLTKKFIFFISSLLIIAILSNNYLILLNKNIDKALISFGFSLKNIYLKGNFKTSKLELEKYLDFEYDSNIFRFKLKKAKSSIESNPWVKEASIKVILPDTIEIRVIEEEAIALWKNENKIFIVNKSGNIIKETYNLEYENLITVSGDKALGRIKELKSILAYSPNIAKKVSFAKLISNRRWSLKYENNLYIELPEKNPGEAIKLLENVDKKHGLLSHNLSSIDLRIEERMVLKLGKGIISGMSSEKDI